MSFENKLNTIEQYLRTISGQVKEPDLTSLDHNYSKAWYNHPDSHHTRPAKMLFMKGLPFCNDVSSNCNPDEEIDIVSCDESLTSPFDNPKSHILMNETDKHLKYNPLLEETEDKEENIIMNNDGQLVLKKPLWTEHHRKLYLEVMTILQKGKLARLAYVGSINEPIKRRIFIDKASKQIRRIFANIFWDRKLLSWLHNIIMDNSNTSTISVYLDILQVLKAKLPNLVDKMLGSSTSRALPHSSETINHVLKRPWDPVQPVLNQYKPKKLRGNPIIIVIPHTFKYHNGPNTSHRLRLWNNYLSSLCKVVNIPFSLIDKQNLTIEEYFDQILEAVKNKIHELKKHYPYKPIILLGWCIGALISCQVALEEPVLAIICLGFPLTGVNGSRGDLDDPLLNSKIPTLFIVGQNSNLCSTDDVEDFRARMQAETHLVIVGGADDLLRISQLKQKTECITQSIVDRCLVDEINDFLSSVLNIEIPSTSSMNQFSISEDVSKRAPGEEVKRRRRKPKDYSPELSPVRKRSRYFGGRQSSPASTKVKFSPSSSETSSCDSPINEKFNKKTKRSLEKRVGRSPTGAWRKKNSQKMLIEKNNESLLSDNLDGTSSQNTSVKSHESGLSKPFSVNILRNKNDPVDVEKAFGRDSSYLPRPLTPQEPEDTVSAEETENAMSELESLADMTSPKFQHLLSNATTSFATEPIPEKSPFESISKQISTSEDNSSNTKVVPSLMVQKPIVASKISESDLPSLINTSTSSFKPSFSHAKILSGTFQSLKPASNANLNTSTQINANTSKPLVLTMPSGNSPTFLVSRPDGKTQTAKMIQVHKIAPNLSTLGLKSAPSTSISSDTSDQQSCNLSLLSDVAHMKERIQNVNTSNESTFGSIPSMVNITKSDMTNENSFKSLKVIKSSTSVIRPPSPPAHLETPEEMVEKQLAIQALNNIDSPSTSSKEPGYSICYAKPDGSIISRNIPKPNFSVRFPTPTSIRGQGRGRPRTVFPMKGIRSVRYS